MLDDRFTTLGKCPRRWHRGVWVVVIAFAVLLSVLTVNPARNNRGDDQHELLGPNNPTGQRDDFDAGELDLQTELARQLIFAGKYRQALPALSAILKDQPKNVDALVARAEAWQQLGKYENALIDYEVLYRLAPPYPRNLLVYNNLAYLLATSPNDEIRDGKRAVDLAKLAVQLEIRPTASVLDTLAAAYAEVGEFDRAISAQQEAIQLEPGRNSFRLHLQLYQSGKPLRDSVPAQPGSGNDDQGSAVDSPSGTGSAETPIEIPIIVVNN